MTMIERKQLVKEEQYSAGMIPNEVDFEDLDHDRLTPMR